MGRTQIDYSTGLLTEAEVLRVKSRLNESQSGADLAEETKDAFYNNSPEEGYRLTPEQTKKGLDWLKNQWKTPTGRVRKNNPFGHRETAIIENFKEFRLGEFYNTANYYQAQHGIKGYVPYYTVIAEDGATFEYYVHAGRINITG